MNNAKITIIGHLTKEPVLKENESGKLLILNVAVQTKKKSLDGSSVTDFYSVRYRGKNAEMLYNKLKKSTKVICFGDFFTEAKVSESQNVSYRQLSIEANDINMLQKMKAPTEEEERRAELLDKIYKSMTNGGLSFEDVEKFYAMSTSEDDDDDDD